MDKHDQKITVSDLIRFQGDREGEYWNRLDNKNYWSYIHPSKHDAVQAGVCVHKMVNKYLKNFLNNQSKQINNPSICLSELPEEHDHHIEQYNNLKNRLEKFLGSKKTKNFEIYSEYKIQSIFNFNKKTYLINGQIDLLIKYLENSENIYEILDFKICKKNEFNIFKYKRQLKVYKWILKRELNIINSSNIKLFLFYSYHKKKIIPIADSFSDCYIKYFLNKWIPACDCHQKINNTLVKKIELTNFKKSGIISK